MRPVKLLSIALMLTGIFFLGKATAQIKIGTNGANIQPSSLLELESANQGFLLPRMANTIAIDALNPPNGMMIYKTTDPAGLYIRKNNQWEYITGSMNGDAVFNSVTVTGPVTAVSFSGPLNGNATSANTATTANNSLSSTVTNDLSTSQPTYPIFVTQTPGITPLRTSTTKLSFVPNTGILTAVGFNGPLVGDVTGNASSATNATNASNTDISDDISTAAVHYPTFVSGITGNLPHRTSSTNLSYTPSTGELKAVRFLGNLTGNASSSDNAITTTITNDNASASLVYPTFVTNSSGNWGQRTANTRLTFVPSTGLLTAGSFTSTIPTGTAPLTVASTTTVANLGATNTLNTNITDDVATTSSVYPTFVTATSGNQNQRTASSRLSFIPSTGALTASSFVGPLNGNATSATTAVDATNSANSAISNDVTTPTVAYPVFVNGSPGNQPLHVGTTNMSYVPSTGILTARGFVGPLTGNVTGTATASLDAENTVNMRITDDVISATPVYPTFVTGTSGPLPPKVSGGKLSFIPSLGELTATTFRGALIGNSSTATTVIGNVAAVNGGTGQASYSPGDLLYATTSTELSRLAIGAPNTVLRVSAGNFPVWSTAGAGTVTTVTGAANRITVTDGSVAPALDIAATYAGQSSITTLGTIGTGTWNGAVIGATYGGTGLSTHPAGRILVGNGTGPLSNVNGDVAGLVLTSNGAGFAPTFQSPGAGDMVTTVAQTITGAKTFGQAGNVGKLILAGNVSGTTILNGPATGTSGTVVLPQTGVLVTQDGIETLTNKNLTSPTMSNPTIGAATGTSLVLSGGQTLSTTNQTGTGSIVMSSGASLTNPNIGTASGTSLSVTGSVTAPGGFVGNASTASSVGGRTGAFIASGVDLANAAVSANTSGAIVIRDGSGGFSAGTITATLVGNATNVTGVVAIANGGTGENNKTSSFNALSPITTAGDIIYGNGANSSTRLAAGGTNTFLKGGATPSWSTINLAAASPEITGVLPAGNGGTGVSNTNTLTLGNHNVTLTTVGATNVTLPTSGTLVAALPGTLTHDFPSTTTFSDITLTVTGAADGDAVSLGVPSASIIPNGIFTAWVSAANTVTIRISSTNGAAADSPTGTFTVKVLK